MHMVLSPLFHFSLQNEVARGYSQALPQSELAFYVLRNVLRHLFQISHFRVDWSTLHPLCNFLSFHDAFLLASFQCSSSFRVVFLFLSALVFLTSELRLVRQWVLGSLVLTTVSDECKWFSVLCCTFSLHNEVVPFHSPVYILGLRNMTFRAASVRASNLRLTRCFAASFPNRSLSHTLVQCSCVSTRRRPSVDPIPTHAGISHHASFTFESQSLASHEGLIDFVVV